MVDAHVVVMAQRGVDHFRPFAVALEQLGADLGMAAFHLVIGRLADVVQQAAAAGQACRPSPISSAIMPVRNATSIECRSTFWL